MAKATLTVRLADMPQVKTLVKQLENEVDDLRHLLQEFEPRVRCRQCGERYSHRACGPSHAIAAALIKGSPRGSSDGWLWEILHRRAVTRVLPSLARRGVAQRRAPGS